jgi:hypothetical protein
VGESEGETAGATDSRERKKKREKSTHLQDKTMQEGEQRASERARAASSTGTTKWFRNKPTDYSLAFHSSPEPSDPLSSATCVRRLATMERVREVSDF